MPPEHSQGLKAESEEFKAQGNTVSALRGPAGRRYYLTCDVHHQPVSHHPYPATFHPTVVLPTPERPPYEQDLCMIHGGEAAADNGVRVLA